MTYDEFYDIIYREYPQFSVWNLSSFSISAHVLIKYKDKTIGKVSKNKRHKYALNGSIWGFKDSQDHMIFRKLVIELADTPLDGRYKKEEKFYWRVLSSEDRCDRPQYLNIIEGGEAIMIYDRENRPGYQTLITIREYEELQDRFSLDTSGFIQEPENSVAVEEIESCGDCPYECQCGGWELYKVKGRGVLRCFSWRPGDIVMEDE